MDLSYLMPVATAEADGCISGTTGCQPCRKTSTDDGGVITTARSPGGRGTGSMYPDGVHRTRTCPVPAEARRRA